MTIFPWKSATIVAVALGADEPTGTSKTSPLWLPYYNVYLLVIQTLLLRQPFRLGSLLKQSQDRDRDLLAKRNKMGGWASFFTVVMTVSMTLSGTAAANAATVPHHTAPNYQEADVPTRALAQSPSNTIPGTSCLSGYDGGDAAESEDLSLWNGTDYTLNLISAGHYGSDEHWAAQPARTIGPKSCVEISGYDGNNSHWLGHDIFALYALYEIGGTGIFVPFTDALDHEYSSTNLGLKTESMFEESAFCGVPTAGFSGRAVKIEFDSAYKASDFQPVVPGTAGWGGKLAEGYQVAPTQIGDQEQGLAAQVVLDLEPTT